jgi:hypothetical protein
VSITVVRCAGGPRERGLAVGRALAEPIARSMDCYRAFLEGRGIGTGDLPRLLGPHRDAARAVLPELAAELDAVAEGAGAPPWDLFAANAWEKLEPMLAAATLFNMTAHTNHYLAPPLADGGWVGEGSVSRLDRLRDLLTEREPITPGDAMAILADHGSEPQAICVHPDPADGDEAVGVLFSMVCHGEERRMWVADGNPCSTRFEEIDLEGALR